MVGMSIGHRLHIWEFEDQPWLPAAVRDAMTDYLGFVATAAPRMLDPIVDRLAPVLARTGATRLIDRGSGSGGPAQVIARALAARGQPVQVTLTDLYPNRARFERARAAGQGRIDYVADPVDATSVRMPGFRMMNNAFHHLRADLARNVLADAVGRREGIAIVEMVGRSPAALLGMLLVPLVVLLVTPAIKPRTLARFVFTYLVPLVPLLALWDGVVSCLRVYSPRELRALLAEVPGAEGYEWIIEEVKVPGSAARATLLVGAPR
jgi:hypothetical protein